MFKKAGDNNLDSKITQHSKSFKIIIKEPSKLNQTIIPNSSTESFASISWC